MTAMQQAINCVEGYFCRDGSTNSIMLESTVETGYYGDYNITGKGEFLLCLPGKFCPKATAASKVRQLECLRNYYCPLGTAGELDLTGQFNMETLKQLNKWVLIEEIRDYIRKSEQEMRNFEERWLGTDIEEYLKEAADMNDTTSI